MSHKRDPLLYSETKETPHVDKKKDLTPRHDAKARAARRKKYPPRESNKPDPLIYKI